MQRLSIDLETMGNRPSSAIVQIGAYLIEGREEQPSSDRSLLVNVDLEDCLRLGLTVDASTIYWWLKQSEVARASLTSPAPVPLRDALRYLTRWVERRLTGPSIDLEMWSHSSFDAAIIHNAFTVARMSPPWRYFQALDLRTLRYVPGESVDLKRGSQREHTADWDAFAQGQEVAAKLS